MPRKVNPAKIFVCSFGLLPGQISLDTLARLREADKVFFIALEKGLAPFITEKCRDREFIGALPPGEQLRRIFADAAPGKNLAVLTYGDPGFMCNTTAMLSGECTRRRMRLEVAPAVSSFNALCALLELNMLSPGGLYMVGANSFTAGEVRLDPDVPALVFQADALLRRDMSAARKKFFSALRRYPPDSPVIVARAKSLFSPEGGRLVFTASRAREMLPHLDAASTVYIPGVRKCC
jgi:hypothetical protein